MNPAIIVFARVPRAGHVKTRLEPELGREGAAALYSAFINDIDSKVRLLGVPVRWYVTPSVADFSDEVISGSLHLQHGDDLGERLEAAFEETSSAGYSPVVVIGTDSPSLPTELLRRAFRELSVSGSSVLGPSADGGYYLLGLNGVAPDFFRRVRYSRPDVAERTRDELRQSGARLLELPEWYDVDDGVGLNRLRSELREHPERAPVTAQALGGEER
jgi:uncharacterized protein